jgi:glycosyltransferase involved in cell wall biosynthesis
MRIVHVTNILEAGTIGHQVHTLNLAVAQKARGHDVAMIVDRAGAFTETCRQNGITVVLEPGLEQEEGAPVRPVERTMQSLITRFRNLNAELIHCHTENAAWQAIPAGNRVQLPCVFTLHFVPVRSWKEVVQSTGLQITTITVSRAVFDKLSQDGLSEPDLYYVPNGTQAMPPPDPQDTRQPGKPGFISVGSVSPAKGMDFAILVMAELRRRLGQDCPALNIYGSGSREDFFREMTTVLGLADIVRFRGTRPGILEHCPSTDILMVTSREETGPLVVLEAMSRGMPIVTTDVGSVREMLPDRRYGRISPVDAIVAFADAAESMLSDISSGDFDPGLLIARHRSCYTSDKMAERIEEVYRQILPSRVPVR